MKRHLNNLMTYESFEKKYESGDWKEFFTGHKTKEDKENSKNAIINDIEMMTQKMADKQTQYPNRFVFLGGSPDEQIVLLNQEAEDDNWRGIVEYSKSPKTGKIHLVYRPKETGFQGVAGSAASGTRVLGNR